jgi:hypothetical protein
MSDLLKNAAKRGLKKAALWASTGKNPPRLKAMQAWWQRHVGDQNEVNALREQYASLIHAPDKGKLLVSHERKIHSQFGEDGLLLHFFSKIGAPNKTFIEFGIEDGTECNAANLALNFGWGGLFIEGSDSLADRARVFYHRERGISANHVKIRSAFITKENINDLFVQNGMTGEIDFLSVDVDGVDYWLYDAITVVQPRLVVLEFSTAYGPHRSLTVPYEPSFERYAKHPSGYYQGASLTALTKLAERKGLVLVGCGSAGANAFFVRRDLAAQAGLPIFTPAEAFEINAAWLARHANPNAFEVIKHLPLVEV